MKIGKKCGWEGEEWNKWRKEEKKEGDDEKKKEWRLLVENKMNVFIIMN